MIAPFNILFEDNHLLVVFKKAGLLVQGDASGRANLLDLAKNYIKDKYGKPGRAFLGLVHRLDRQVAGIIVLARTSKAAGRLSTQFREHLVKKVYLAVVHGRPNPESGWLDDALVRQGFTTITTKPDDPGALKASLFYRTIETRVQTSLLEVDLLTGRRHQIRVQLATLGCPILGDRKYGSPLNPPDDSIGLMAVRLVFRHPTHGQEMAFEVLPPADWCWWPRKADRQIRQN